ncbi:PAS domain S-box protein, partial [Pseudomonas frederiksbergensis]|nr:PAS domain S-box protein [Pseudomonas frederiksbergensis]
MKSNLPVTGRNVDYPGDANILSTTDLTSQITYANDDFIKVSGFTREELIGSAHHIVRHPDMPPAVFALMWQYLKAGQSWMGIVKNRCKNGNFYWVSAYVTPILEDGRLVGYESVRVKPTREQVRRAEELYARLREGKPAVSAGRRLAQLSQVMSLPLAAGAVAVAANQALPGWPGQGITLGLFGLIGLWAHRRLGR